MKNKLKKTAAAAVAVSVMLTAAACNYETAASETTQGIPGEPTSSTVDYSEYTFETMYGSQLIGYLDHQYYFEGQPIPLAESNYYFIDAFLELSQMGTYGMYPVTAEGYLDLSAPVTGNITADDSGETYNTYGDFFVKYAEGMLENTYIINSLAAEENITLPDDQIAEIDDVVDNVFTANAAAGGITIDEYLQLFYGESCDVQTMRDIMYHYKLADIYTSDFIDNYEFNDEDILVPNVRYALYYAPDGSTEEDVAAQEELANALLEQSVDEEGNPSLEQFELYGVYSESQGECYQYGEVPVERGQMVSDFEDWAYDESREEGDIEVIYSPDYGYFVVGYLGLTEIPEEEKDQMAVQGLVEFVQGLIDSGEYEFYTDTEFVPASPVVPSPTDPATGLPIDTSAKKKIDTKQLVISILAGIGGVAVIGLVVYAIGSLIKKGNNGKVDEIEDVFDDEPEDGDTETTEGFFKDEEPQEESED